MHRNIDMNKNSFNSNVSISINKLVKSYNETFAVNNLSFNINERELFGIIGPDGAGKTTLFRIIATLIIPDSGYASILGYDVVKDYKEIRKIVGYMPGHFSLYNDLTVEENLSFFATIYGTTIKENFEVIRDIYSQIEPFKKRLAGHLSGGMKQKLALSCALIHKPKILILDEPTTGVDAVSRKEFWEILRSLRKYGITIIVSTPYMDEAVLCDKVALIQNGSIMTINTPQNIIKLFDSKLLAIKSSNMYQLLLLLKQWENTDKAYLSGQFIHLTLKNDDTTYLLNYLKNNSCNDAEIQSVAPNVEDVFIKLMTNA